MYRRISTDPSSSSQSIRVYTPHTPFVDDPNRLSHTELSELAIRFPPTKIMSLGDVHNQVGSLIPHMINPTVDRARSMIAFGPGPTFGSTRDSMVQSLMDLALTVAAGTLPGATCYIDLVPTAVVDIMLMFLTPKEQSCIRGTCGSMNSDVVRLTTVPTSYYIAGRVLWVATTTPSGRVWTPGIVLPCGIGDSSVIDMINPKSLESHVGYHIQCSHSYIVEYIPQSIIGRHTSTNPTIPMRPVPDVIQHTTTHTPYGYRPHQICAHGHYTNCCGRYGNKSTAPSQCCVLLFNPHITPRDVGLILPGVIGGRSITHTIESKAIEKLYGYAFSADGTDIYNEQFRQGGFFYPPANPLVHTHPVPDFQPPPSLTQLWSQLSNDNEN
jgi:hypothetical protein